MNITYQTDKIKIEKLYRETGAIVNGKKEFAFFWHGYSRIPVPYTFGLFKRWIPTEQYEQSEALAAATSAKKLFTTKYNVYTDGNGARVESQSHDKN
jgi:hypothetical protein